MAQDTIEIEDIDFFEAIGASDIPEEEKGALVARIVGTAQSTVLADVLEIFSKEQQEELARIAKKEDPDALEDFLLENVPDYAERFRQAILHLRRQLIQQFS